MKNVQFTGDVFAGGREYAVAFMSNYEGTGACTLYFTTSVSTANIQVQMADIYLFLYILYFKK